MRALVCPEIGAFERLAIGDLPEPHPGPGQVLIDMEYAGVNFADLLVLQDLYQFKAVPPFAPGMEGSGTVVGVGEGVAGIEPGDRVSAVGYSGAMAQRWVAEGTNVLPVPDDIGLDVAAAMTIAYGTSYHALVQRARLEPGETLLVLGAAGGVGSAAVDIGRALGAEVIAVASTEAKRALALELGASAALSSESDGLRSALEEATAGRGIDVVYDPVGGALSEPAFRSLARNGRHLVIGFAAGDIPSLPMNLALLKEASLVGVFWGSFSAHEPEVNRSNVAAMYDLVRNGDLQPRITERFDLSEAARALATVAERQVTGRVLVEI